MELFINFCVFDIMKITFIILWLSIVSVSGQGLVTAQEKDPFFPEAGRSSVTATTTQQDAWGRDPFNRPFEGKAQSGQAKESKSGLTGIIHGRNTHVAIIGGEAYKEGSYVEGRQLVQIRRRSVVFRSSSGSVEEVFVQDFSIRK